MSDSHQQPHARIPIILTQTRFSAAAHPAQSSSIESSSSCIGIAGSSQQPGLARISPASARVSSHSRQSRDSTAVCIKTANKRTTNNLPSSAPAAPQSRRFHVREHPGNHCQTLASPAGAVDRRFLWAIRLRFSIAWSESTQLEAKPRSRSFASRLRGRSRFAQPCWPPPHDPAIISSYLCCIEKTQTPATEGGLLLRTGSRLVCLFFFIFFIVPSPLPFHFLGR